MCELIGNYFIYGIEEREKKRTYGPTVAPVRNSSMVAKARTKNLNSSKSGILH